VQEPPGVQVVPLIVVDAVLVTPAEAVWVVLSTLLRPKMLLLVRPIVKACDPLPGPAVPSPVNWVIPPPPATAVIIPPDAVMVVPSTLTAPKVLDEAWGIAGAASERMAVIAVPLTAAVPMVADGLSNPVIPPPGLHEPPSVQVVPLTVSEGLTRSVLATEAQVAAPLALRERGNWLVQLVPP
jgi:hypothetical protein